MSLCAGTTYLYGVYSPQLIQQCKLDAQASGTLSFASNIGSALGGLPAGLVIDKFGPGISILIGGICQFIGFGSLHLAYRFALESVFLLSVAMVFTGFGSVISYYSALKVATTNFPNHRGTAGTCPVASYGLSALVFSTLAAKLFPDNTGGLLLFMSFFAGSVICFSSPFVKIVEPSPLQHAEESLPDPETRPLQSAPKAISKSNPKSYGSLLNTHRGSFAQLNFAHYLNSGSPSSLFSVDGRESLSSDSASALSIAVPSSKGHSPSSSLSQSPNREVPRRGSLNPTSLTTKSPRGSTSSLSNMYIDKIRAQKAQESRRANSDTIEEEPFVNPVVSSSHPASHSKKHSSSKHIKRLVTDKYFLVHFLILASISAMGQVYIYSVGFIVKAQFSHARVSIFNIPIESSEAFQALQVSLISLCSFFGRLLSGPTSDFIHKRLHCQRLWVITAAVIFSAYGNYLCYVNDDPAGLSLCSIIIGLAYGSYFGVYPAVMADFFGSKGFTTTWGLICTGPLIGLFWLTRLFGTVYDRNSERDIVTGHKVCLKGKNCYNTVFEVNIYICFACVAVLLLLIALKRAKR